MDEKTNEMLGAFDEWKEEKSTQHDMIEDVKKKSES